ncbi:TIM barrel protein [Gymnodinialimonas sp. 57CJ19]|uniref:TIM barrel protein n=1 Tax=Gymnodinialimonas sp. 57CJ19 TaxID=3138498 RepID=UPI003134345D
MVPDRPSATPERPRLICASHTIAGALPGQGARHGFHDRVDAVSRAGFDGMLVHFRDHAALVADGADPVALRDAVSEAGLSVPAVEFLADWHDAPDLGSAEHAIATAQLFGATHINVGADIAGKDIPLTDLIPPFQNLCRRASDAGLGIALELISWGRISALPDAIALVDAGGAAAGLLLDAWHLSVSGPLDTDRLSALDPSLVVGVQISDAFPMTPTDLQTRLAATQNRLFPGEGGGVDSAGFLAALWPAACRHGVTVEVISPQAAAMPAKQCARYAAETGRRAVKQAAALIRDDR